MDKPGPSSSRANNFLRTDDPEFSRKIQELLQDDNDEFDDDDSEDLDVDDDPEFIPADPRSEPSALENEFDESDVDEDEEEEVDEAPIQQPLDVYIGKDGTQWKSSEPVRSGRPPANNILKISGLPGLSNYAQQKLGQSPSESEVWHTLFDDSLINELLLWTNHHLQEKRTKLTDKKTLMYHSDLTKEELWAFIGLLMLCATTKSNAEDTKSLFRNDEFGRTIFRLVMSRNRFVAIKTSLRFDNPADRPERQKNDKAAAVSYIFFQFVNNSRLMFVPGGTCTIDETLLPFKGRCSFRVYMPNKPAKYGLKVMSLVDSRTSYFSNGYLYTGKGCNGFTLPESERKLAVPTQSLLRLAKPLYGSNRNITADNWFSSLEAVLELRKKNLTFVGIVRKNKKFLPQKFVNHKGRPLYDELYGFSEKVTLFSQKVKSNKVVLLISSMHHNKHTDEETGKPEMVAFYNQTKGGVDTLDYMTSVYSSKRKGPRWPYVIFSGMLNISLVNAFILHKCFVSSKLEPRNVFLRKLATQLIIPHLTQRAEHPFMNTNLRNEIKKFLDPSFDVFSTEIHTLDDDKLKKRKTCYLCNYKKQRKTAYVCRKCKKPICLECSRKLCLRCAVEIEMDEDNVLN